MAYAASRYTEAKPSPICAELFRDLDCDAVDFVDNYDNTMKEPSLLPTTFPNVLVSANQGHRRGHGVPHLRFQSGRGVRHHHRLSENPDHDIPSTLLAPDFPTGVTYPLRRRRAAGDLPHRPRRREGPQPLSLRQEGESHRGLRDPLFHLHRGHSGQGGGAGEGRQGEGRSTTCGTRAT